MQELWFLRSACCLVLTDICMKFREDSLNSFQIRADMSVTDRQADRQMPGGKTICVPTLKWGDIIRNKKKILFGSPLIWSYPRILTLQVTSKTVADNFLILFSFNYFSEKIIHDISYE